ncbi:hypothetical protein BDY24DRAFT_391867 [Mrakia frigida]|uniref:uncharacterized protein n=1 Tax=Mrakia frigida TaxID=29902 RepID=UPI003FCC03CA
MKLLTTLPTPSPSATPSADSTFKPYTTASVKAKLSFPASTVPSLGFPSLLRRRSSAGAGDAEEIHFSSMEYVFVGKLSVQEKSILFTLYPSPTPYARHLGNEAPTSPTTRRLSIQSLFSRPVVTRPSSSPPPELEIEEEEGAPTGGPKKLRLKRTVSKGFKDYPLFIDNKPLLAFEFTVDELSAPGSHIVVHKSKASASSFTAEHERVPAAVVVTLPSGPEGHTVGTRLELIFGEALSDDLEAEALEYHLQVAQARGKGGASSGKEAGARGSTLDSLAF